MSYVRCRKSCVPRKISCVPRKISYDARRIFPSHVEISVGLVVGRERERSNTELLLPIKDTHNYRSSYSLPYVQRRKGKIEAQKIEAREGEGTQGKSYNYLKNAPIVA